MSRGSGRSVAARDEQRQPATNGCRRTRGWRRTVTSRRAPRLRRPRPRREPDVRGNYYAVAASTNLREDLSLDDPYSGSCADAVTSVFPGLTDRVLLRYFNAPLRTAASGSRVLSPPPSPPPSPPSPADEPPLTGPADGPSGDPGGDTTTAASKGKRRREMEAVLGRGAVAGVAAGRTEHDVAPGAHVRPQWQRPAA